ncbi:hypothetical protein MKW98_003678 [Papaver atlanticum]|uniref:Uncharacterized protein n=1 Tax=Papaver atlanticum TaxID=357466 RepID=A0AAD4XDY9_9MAGN|nr:hypothetical protein MKW98_003678 [Papaver atlanticum]
MNGRKNDLEEDPIITGKLRHSFNAIQYLVKEIKPIGLTERAVRYLRKAAYSELFKMYYEEYDEKKVKQITTNKHGVVKILNCFDRDSEIPCSFKFGDKFIESAPEKCAGILAMKNIGSRKGQKLLKQFTLTNLDENVLYNKYFTDIKHTAHPMSVSKKNIIEKIKQVMSKTRRTKLDDQHVVCMIGLYLCCVLFFGDINAGGVNVRFFAIIETYETVLKILFVEHTPSVLIPKVQNHEKQIPRVGRWDVQQISDFISSTNMTEFLVSVLYYLVYILYNYGTNASGS